ncbi:17395_t:CDS:2, partial [Funneliformis geosporum]
MPIGNFNEHYKILLDQLPLSIKKDVWLCLTNRKNKPLSKEQIRDIYPEIEKLLTREVNRYYNKKNRQKIKIEANTSSDGSSTLSCLDGFEKQLEKHELHRQYKSQITTLEKSIVIKGKEIGKLSSTISQLKNDKKDIKKSAERKCNELEDVIFVKDLKIIALNDKIISYNPHVGRDATILL